MILLLAVPDLQDPVRSLLVLRTGTKYSVLRTVLYCTRALSRRCHSMMDRVVRVLQCRITPEDAAKRRTCSLMCCASCLGLLRVT
jgi:hypothetical protein